MSIENLLGSMAEAKRGTTSNLINTELLELITPKSHGTKFSFNVLKIMPKGEVTEQAHPEEHAVLVLDGKCNILLGEEWVTVQKGDYVYIPPEMTHAFINEGNEPSEILILKH